jgi:hypothetical protein
MDVLPDDTLLEWCDLEPTARYPMAAACVTLFKRPKNDAPYEWTPLVSRLLTNAPEPRQMLSVIVDHLHPRSWSGSLATKLEGRLRLLEILPVGGAPELLKALRQAKASLQERIGKERQREADQDRVRNGKFE